jgi:hypothetical protein
MAVDISTSSTSIPFGTNLRIGYRTNGSIAAFTYVPYYPSFNELPYTFTVPTAGEYEIEYTVVCNACVGAARYSEPETTVVTVV